MAEMMRSNVELSRHAQVTEQDNLVMKVCNYLLPLYYLKPSIIAESFKTCCKYLYRVQIML